MSSDLRQEQGAFDQRCFDLCDFDLALLFVSACEVYNTGRLTVYEQEQRGLAWKLKFMLTHIEQRGRARLRPHIDLIKMEM